ncbi:hypothetical protein [uncultured Microbacterium sp.]|uniref:hypothetical protein n=1 Tax=uncultured Microbacterium sp. TaxID=191216 RepID=UPI0025F57DA4|nr:hypothetical protein [uncultured Microbacterium sp.]
MTLSAAAVLVEPLDSYLYRRARSARALTPGEAVTAAIGLLRGCRRATGRFDAARWWLRADGCPIAVEEASGPDPVAATADSLARAAEVAGDPPTRDILARARESVLTRPPREWETVERRLLAHAEPVPLVLAPLSPVEAPNDPVAAERRDDASSPVLALVDADLADGVRAAGHELLERWRSSRALRLGTVIAGIVALIVAGAALLPDSDAPAAPAATTKAVGPSDPAPVVAPARGETPSPAPADDRVPLSDDVVAAARQVFAEITACGEHPSCVGAYEEESSFPREPLLTDAAHGDIELLDDFGGVVVVRVGTDTATQYVTLVRQNDRWLVRAVRTVADQPS